MEMHLEIVSEPLVVKEKCGYSMCEIRMSRTYSCSKKYVNPRAFWYITQKKKTDTPNRLINNK